MITLQTVIDALGHCSDRQERDLLKRLNEGGDLSAGAILGEIVREFVESIEEDDSEPDLDNPSIDAIRSDRLKGYS